jgi:8-oxo-dGTP pyrophosphatase MutT (NUDIX family)
MKLITTLDPENATEDEISNFETRTIIRAVVLDSGNNIGFIYVGKHKYHKLPGGGQEKDESNYDTLERECLEELGCNVEILGEVGEIIEYRKTVNTKQTAICYLAKVIGEKGQPFFTEEETENEFEVQWVPIKEAISLLESDKPLNEEGRSYVVPREKLFLKEAIGLNRF